MPNCEKEIDNIFIEHYSLVKKTKEDCAQKILKSSQLIAESLKSGAKLFFCGNGGSAADSQHLAAEFVGRFKKDRKPLSSIALTTDTSILTCISNDYSFDDIFSRQLNALAKEGDILIGLSTSGNSKNIINALKAGNNLQMKTILFSGKNGGIANKLANNSILIPSNSTARIQEMHILLGHIICEIVEKELNLN